MSRMTVNTDPLKEVDEKDAHFVSYYPKATIDVLANREENSKVASLGYDACTLLMWGKELVGGKHALHDTLAPAAICVEYYVTYLGSKGALGAKTPTRLDLKLDPWNLELITKDIEKLKMTKAKSRALRDRLTFAIMCTRFHRCEG